MAWHLTVMNRSSVCASDRCMNGRCRVIDSRVMTPVFLKPMGICLMARVPPTAQYGTAAARPLLWIAQEGIDRRPSAEALGHLSFQVKDGPNLLERYAEDAGAGVDRRRVAGRYYTG